MAPKTGAPFACTACHFRSSIRRQRQSFIDIRIALRHSSTTALSFSKSSTTPGYYPPPDQLQKQGYAHLKNRSLLRLQGLDVVSFLNGLLPSRLHSLPKNTTSPIFTTFLTAKGRILYDVFIYPPKESDESGAWYFDVDTASASSLFSHLKKHKLRSKFKLEKISQEELGVYYIWPGGKQSSDSITIGGQDPRPLMGTRFLSSSSDSPILSALAESGEALTIEGYKIHRMITGHAEGPTELIANSALPQESNIEFLQGIDFHKGCYLGQELTIRTHHTGVVRKRILPCQISSQPIPKDREVVAFDSSIQLDLPPPESNISKFRSSGRAGRSTGKWLGGVGNIGLALCRLEMMTDIELTSEGTSYSPDDQFKIVWEDNEPDSDGKTNVHEVVIQPFVPDWLRQSIQASIQARSERGRRKRQTEEDEDVDDTTV